MVGTIEKYVDIPNGDEEALKEALATVGPISIAINAGLRTFAFYKTGNLTILLAPLEEAAPHPIIESCQ